jgi:hypothetical protein
MRAPLKVLRAAALRTSDRPGADRNQARAGMSGYQVESNVPGRETGGSSRTVGSTKACGELAAGRRGVTVTGTETP